MILQYFTKNMSGRDFIIGDLHGRLDCLRQKMAEADFNPLHDRIFSVGDLIDRGPKSDECLDLVSEEWFYSVQGNHENMMCRAVDALVERDSYSGWNDWMANGGGWFETLSCERMVQLAHLVSALPLAIEVELRDGRRIGITHAEPPCLNWNDVEKTLADPMAQWRALWNRRISQCPITITTEGIDLTVHGHSYVPQACLNSNAALIDQGAGLLEPGVTKEGGASPMQLSFIQLESLFNLPSMRSI